MDFGRGRIKGSYSAKKWLEDCNIKEESYHPHGTETPYEWDVLQEGQHRINGCYRKGKCKQIAQKKHYIE